MISGRVISSEIDDNGNIQVNVEYTLTDGSKEIKSTWYNCFSFSADRILQDIKSHCEDLMRNIYNLKQNKNLIQIDISDISYQCDSVDIAVQPAITDEQGNVTQEAIIISVDDSNNAVTVNEIKNKSVNKTVSQQI